MRRFNHFIVIITALCVSNALTSVAYADEYKIGVVNAGRILNQSPQARKTTALIENEFSPRTKQLVEEGKDLQTMEERREKDAATMSVTVRRNLERDIVKARRKLIRDEDELREDLNYRRNESPYPCRSPCR